MTTKYECDITGESYYNEEFVFEVGLHEESSLVETFEYGPNATEQDIKERLKEIIDDWTPYHSDWWDEDEYKVFPPQRGDDD